MKFIPPKDASYLALIAQHTYKKEKKDFAPNLYTMATKLEDSESTKLAVAMLSGKVSRVKEIRETVEALYRWVEACRTVHAPPRKCKCDI